MEQSLQGCFGSLSSGAFMGSRPHHRKGQEGHAADRCALINPSAWGQPAPRVGLACLAYMILWLITKAWLAKN
ncbi:MAG: hypothetical protein ACK486_06255, partial [Cyanobacteriota bacterium]